MYDNFLLDNYETKYFYELLLKRGFYLKARQVFSYGVKNDYFKLEDKKTWGFTEQVDRPIYTKQKFVKNHCQQRRWV